MTLNTAILTTQSYIYLQLALIRYSNITDTRRDTLLPKLKATQVLPDAAVGYWFQINTRHYHSFMFPNSLIVCSKYRQRDKFANSLRECKFNSISTKFSWYLAAACVTVPTWHVCLVRNSWLLDPLLAFGLLLHCTLIARHFRSCQAVCSRDVQSALNRTRGTRNECLYSAIGTPIWSTQKSRVRLMDLNFGIYGPWLDHLILCTEHKLQISLLYTYNLSSFLGPSIPSVREFQKQSMIRASKFSQRF